MRLCTKTAQIVSNHIMGIEDDSHVFVILQAHLTGYEDFVTLQYLCGQGTYAGGRCACYWDTLTDRPWE